MPGLNCDGSLRPESRSKLRSPVFTATGTTGARSVKLARLSRFRKPAATGARRKGEVDGPGVGFGPALVAPLSSIGRAAAK